MKNKILGRRPDQVAYNAQMTKNNRLNGFQTNMYQPSKINIAQPAIIAAKKSVVETSEQVAQTVSTVPEPVIS